jgi:hypothetical protein
MFGGFNIHHIDSLKVSVIRTCSMVNVGAPYLMVTLLLATDVLAAQNQPPYDAALAGILSRRLAVENASELRIDFLHFDNLVRRDDCPATDTPCPGMLEAFPMSHLRTFSSSHSHIASFRWLLDCFEWCVLR